MRARRSFTNLALVGVLYSHGAIEDLVRRLHGAGWTIEAVDGSSLSAFDGRNLSTETARLDAEVRDGRASVAYVHR